MWVRRLCGCHKIVCGLAAVLWFACFSLPAGLWRNRFPSTPCIPLADCACEHMQRIDKKPQENKFFDLLFKGEAAAIDPL
jgi:hypothetical protein